MLDYHYRTSEIRVLNNNPFLGPHYGKQDILKVLEKYKDKIWIETKLREQIVDVIAKEIKDGNVIGWFEGRMEFGGESLGNRSILRKPKRPSNEISIKQSYKKREGFRPFAPMVKKNFQTYIFTMNDTVPYMNQVVKVKEEHGFFLPSITHVDNSARIQTVNKNQKYIYELLDKLHQINGYPIVINTSFNLKDQTMVLTPEDAIQTFLDCEMDILVLHNHIIKKKIL